jgi:choloylglycine hydrolase
MMSAKMSDLFWPSTKGAYHPSGHSCSTFLLKRGDELLTGHNLDDYIEVPGLVAANPSGVKKRGVLWDELRSPFHCKGSGLEWESKFGTITYNTFGKDLIDGGMNEAGLYVGEMTLLETRYPSDAGIVRLYHHNWMQYLLDNYSTVDEVISSLSKVGVDGHCRWHFFAADRQANSAVIEFLDGKAVIRKNEQLPVKALCNQRYEKELETLRKYSPFGGDLPVNLSDIKEDRRFVWAAKMLSEDASASSTPTADHCFAILRQLECGNNRWSIVYDIPNLRMYFNTYKSRRLRFVDFKGFDLSKSGSIMVLDVNADLSGDVSKDFKAFNDSMQLESLRNAWGEIKLGIIGNLLYKPMMVRRLYNSTKSPCVK